MLNSKKSGYVVAGADAFLGVMKERTEAAEWPEDFPLKYCDLIHDNYLYSFGSILTKSTRNNMKKLTRETYIPTLTEKIGHFNNYSKDHINLFLDSGGFQATMGYLGEEHLDLFINTYCKFLNEQIDIYDHAFSLDMIFIDGPMANMKKMKEWNDKSYKAMSRLPEETKKKLIFVNHFRTPMLMDIWDNLFDKYAEDHMMADYWSMGGIVTFGTGDQGLPYVSYTIPFTKIVALAKKYERKKISVHVLGGASYRDVFFYKLVEIHVKAIHNIDLNITYDSSAPFKQISTARIMDAFIDDKIYRLNIKESKIYDKIIGLGISVNDYWTGQFNSMIKEMGYNFEIDNELYTKPDSKTLMDKKTGDFIPPFKREVGMLALMYSPYFYRNLENRLEELAIDIYKDYGSSRFDQRVFELCVNLNNRRMTSKQKRKAYGFQPSLDIIADLDLDKCKYLVETYMGKEELYSEYDDVNLTF